MFTNMLENPAKTTWTSLDNLQTSPFQVHFKMILDQLT